MRMMIHLTVAASLVVLGQFIAISAQEQPEQKEDSKIEDIKPIVIKGTLDDDDPRDAVKKDCAHKVHTVKLLASRTYQIDMIWKDEKRAMDPFLRIEDTKKNQLAEDDDSAGDYNARIYFAPPKDDDYRLIATSLYGTGKYEIHVTVVPKIPVVKGVLTFNDRLAANDAQDEARGPGFFCKVYKVNMVKGKTYTIDMVSNQMDSYLRLEDSKKTRLLEDDDSGGNLNARIVFQPQASGTYRVIATTFGAGMQGAFTLTVRDE